MTLIAAIVLILIACAGFSALFGFIFMLLWNWLMPGVFGVGPELTFLQAWGVWFLLSMVGGCFRAVVSK